MPRNTREWAQRKYDMAEGNLGWYINHLQEVTETYVDAHPEIAQDNLTLITMAQMLQKATVKLRMSL